MSDQANSAESIFGQAIEILAADERAAFLEQACGDDGQLRTSVEQLVADHFRAGSFLEEPVVQMAPTALPSITEKAGTHIGPYKLREKIGEGGMGVVYIAEQKTPIKRRVALKIIKPGMDSQQVIARFESERQALAMMDHPNIAKVLDAGATESGHPYFVMELVLGVPITQYCDEERLTPKERLELFVPICRAVQHAHQKGIIHRDLKPSNILVALYDGRPVPKVIDFGVAKATGHTLTEKSVYTQLGQLVGTLEYMSPEQAERNQLDVDTRSDVYSLGVVLYELVTGDTPFERTRLRSAAFDEMLRIIREEEPPRPSTKLSTSANLPTVAANRHTEPKKLSILVRGELDWVVMKALSKDRSQRYETANGLAADVQRYLNNDAVQACPPSVSYRFRKFARKYSVAITTAGLIAAALLIGTVVSTHQAIQTSIAERDARTAESAAKEAKEIAVESQKKAEERGAALAVALNGERVSRNRLESELYFSRISLAHQLWSNTAAGEAEALLDLCSTEFRNWEWHHLKRLCHLDAITITGHAAIISGIDVSADNRRIVTGSWDHTVRIWDIISGEELEILRGHTDLVRSVAFSPDGRKVVSGSSDHTIIVWDTKTGERLLTLEGHDDTVRGVAVSPDGNSIASASYDGTARIWDARTGKVRCKLEGHSGVVACVAFSPDGGQVVTGSWDRNVRIYDVVTGQLFSTLEGHTNTIKSVAFTPNGNCVASASEDSTVRLWNVESGEVVREIDAHISTVSDVAFSPSGDRIFTSSYDDSVKVWDTDSGDLLYTFRGHTEAVFCLAVLSDGTVASAGRDRTVKVWTPTDTVEAVTLQAHMGSVKSISFDQYATRISTVGSDGMLKVWDIATGQELESLRIPLGTVKLASFTRDGTKIVVANNDNSLRILNAATGDLIRAIEGDDNDIRAVATASGSGLIASGTSNRVLLWDGLHEQPILTLVGHKRFISDLAISPDRRYVASSSPGPVVTDAIWNATTRIWDTNTGKEMHVFRRNGVSGPVAFSPDNRLLAFGNSQILEICEVETGKRVAQGRGDPTEALTVKFSPDGKRIISGGRDGKLRIWDALSGRLALVLFGYENRHCLVEAVAVSSDCRFIASGNSDGAVRIWDAGPFQSGNGFAK